MSIKPPSPGDKLVLIVEDDQGMREYLERVAKGEGFRTATAADGLQALKLMQELSPSVALLDLMLPRYGGFELLYELQRGAAAGVPLIIVTARFTGARDKAAISRMPNVAAFLEKPVSAEVLANALHELLGTKKLT